MASSQSINFTSVVHGGGGVVGRRSDGGGLTIFFPWQGCATS
jgi:hypothetical protein